MKALEEQGHFVLKYTIDETEKVVTIVDYEHHT